MSALTYQLEPLATRSAAHTGTSYAIDSSVFTTGVPDWTVTLEIRSLSAGATARFSIQDSVDAFTTVIAGPTFEVGPGLTGTGAQVGQTYPKYFSFTRKDFPGLRFGVASAVLRVSLTLIQGTLPQVQYQATYSGPLLN